MKPMLDRPFDIANLVDARENILTMNLRCSLLSPLQSTPGCAIVTNERIYFQQASGVLIPTATKAMSWSQRDVVATARRYRGLRDSAIEIYWKNGTSVLLAFDRKREREQIMRLLPKNARCFTDRSFVVEVEREWQLGNISNYDYLLALNSAAGRTFHDFSRYPVFPWVIADYQSSKLDLTDEKTFRDLTKPVGALNEERLEYFRTRLLGMQGMEEAFLYGTHYSAPGYVLYYLVRNMPEHMLCLQNGKFDAPDRMFHSLEHCFSCVLSNHADVKELIPEFYNPTGGFDFLINARGLQLGATQNGDRVHDVSLPPWAKSARDFLKKNRRALDSDICTDKLPRWIDLIFGCKSRGESAMEASNLFHRMAYLGPDDLDEMGSDEERFQAELQATEFGIVPDMLFCGPHPLREDPVGSDDFVAPDTGRASVDADNDGGLDIETDLPQGDQHAWEILDRPSQDGSDEFRLRGQSNPMVDANNGDKVLSISANAELTANQQLATPGGKAKASWSSTRDLSEQNDDTENISHLQNGDDEKASGADKMPRTIPLSGSGDWARGEKRPDDISWEQSFSSHDSNAPMKSKHTTLMSSTHAQSDTVSTKAWDMKVLSRNPVHGDTVSGCSIVYEPGSPNRPYLTTVSLDGRLMVHSVSLGVDDSDEQRKNILGTFSRFTSMGISRDSETQNPQVKMNPHRSYTASDPLACLVLTSDGHGGFVAFAGGHDDVVLAYGMNSACAVASVYSHRDAVTGLDLIERNHMGSSSAFWSEKATHLMVSGSWDATVKVWSVAVSAGETVSINREPLAELFDADSTIVCISATAVYSAGILICAGCADGSFVVWLCKDNGVKEVIYKEPARRGAGPCSAVKWVSEAGAVYLYACFSSGKVASFVLDNQKLSSVSAVSLGVPVTCLEYSNKILLAGCSDGGLRLIPIRSGCSFDSKPTLWNGVNGNTSPGLTCISISISSNGPHDDAARCICSTGAEDGSVVLFELKLRVGRSHTVEVMVHIRRKDLNWFAANENSYRKQLFQLLSRKILPKEFDEEMERYCLEKRKSATEDGGQVVQKNGDNTIIIGEANKKKKPPTKPGAKRKRGQKQKEDTPRDNSNSMEERYKFERYVFGETIQVSYRVEDILPNESALLFFNTSKDDSKESKQRASFKKYPKLSKRIILWCYPLDAENPTEPIDGGGFHRPDMIPISSLFRAPAES